MESICGYIGKSLELDTHHSRFECFDSSHTRPGLLQVRSLVF